MGDGPISRRAVFLDRDGVINRAYLRVGVPTPPATLEELEILPGVPQALGRLKRAGLTLIVVTNQPDVARGKQERNKVEEIHDRLKAMLPLDDVRVCYHDDADGCDCRKPKPGLLLQAARELGISLRDSYMVGDRWRDVEAARRAGCKAIFIETDGGELAAVEPDVRVTSLAEAADWILASENREVE